MLFNSLSFLFLFAPVVILGFYLLGARSAAAACAWLGGFSLVFYAMWHPPHTLILLASIVLNFVAGNLIGRTNGAFGLSRSTLLKIAISTNLVALCYFKYAGFFVVNLTAALGLQWTIGEIVLPLGVSFFTFTQIAYLVDTYQDKVKEHNFNRYLLFVTYFPHLVAGPIIHHKDVMSQFEQRATFKFNDVNFSLGIIIFIIGLFKKVVIADNVSIYVAPIFKLAEQGVSLDIATAWVGALAYTIQLYFDFSGYSDMAIGLSMMFNVRLPFNFDSPYKARNIIDFWRRWHISLSVFLRDYLYIPLGGNRLGNSRRYINMGITMLLGGLWHGAGWTFIVWGALHGAYLGVNHFWQARFVANKLKNSFFLHGLSWALTLLAVIVAWVFFRAQTVQGALTMLSAMMGFGTAVATPLILTTGAKLDTTFAFGVVLPLLIITMYAPNSQQIASRLLTNPSSFLRWDRVSSAPLIWNPVPVKWSVLAGLSLSVAMALLSRPSEFLYFNF